MNGALANVSTVLFFACAPVLLVVRFFWPKRMPWWLLVLLAATLSALFTILTFHFADVHFADLSEQAGGLNHPPPKLIAEWANHRGPRTYAFLFGLEEGLLHLMQGLVLYGVAHLLRKASRL